MACTDYVVTVSEPRTEALVRQGLSKDQVGIIRNGVDLNLFRALFRFPRHPGLPLPMSAHSKHGRNIDNLIAAFDKVKNMNIRLLVVGFTRQWLSNSSLPKSSEIGWDSLTGQTGFLSQIY